MGEKRLFAALQTLPDDCIVYYEPLIERRYPDFVIILPSHGVLVIEVKGWYPNNIVKGNSHSVWYRDHGRETEYKHPVRQARDYMFKLMDVCRNHLHSAASLLHANQNRFVFPFGHFCVLSNITSDQMSGRDWADVFPSSRTLLKDERRLHREADPP